MSKYLLQVPHAEFYMNVRDDGLVRVGLRSPFGQYDFIDHQGKDAGIRAWLDFGLPYPLCSSDNLADILGQAAAQSKLHVHAHPSSEIHYHALVADSNGDDRYVCVYGRGNLTEGNPARHLLDVLERVELQAGYYLEKALIHGRRL